MTKVELIKKYTVAAPRYTSYPTVPYWDKEPFDSDKWKQAIQTSFIENNNGDGISIYMHLPYCESLCTYCGCNTRITRNHGIEDPYIKTVLKEWALYKQTFDSFPLIREIHLGGGTPTFFSHENLHRLIEGLLDGCNIHPQAEFSFEAHPNNTTVQHLQTLYSLGFRRLSLGIQDFDPHVQLIINRVQSFEQVKQVTGQAREIGYTSINFDLIYGLPLQTPNCLVDTISKVGQLRPDRIAFYVYAHVPWIKPGQRRYTEADLPDTLEKAALYEFGREMFTRLGYLEIGMDHFALPTDSLYRADIAGTLHRNFMGYTHQYTGLLIGLGVSAISDAWGAYAQNAKTIDEYTRMINNDQLSVVKGHFLTDEDLVIRRLMLDIMCKGTIQIPRAQLTKSNLGEALVRLHDLAYDGLIFLENDLLSVTPLGKRFLRNICMALDARFWADKPNKQIFSMTG